MHRVPIWFATFVATALVASSLSPLIAQTTFTVNTADDVDDGTCDATHCSLREALNAANTDAGTDQIDFDIGGTGPHTIRPAFALPTITDPVIIDGYTQSGASPNTNPPELGSNAVLMIELDGSDAGSTHGLLLTAGGNTVRGLVINRFNETGIYLSVSGGNAIEGNFIGTDVSGTVDLGNGDRGLLITSPNNTIGGTTPEARNVISGNLGNVRITDDDATGNVILGNLIGTDITGTIAVDDSLTLPGVSINAASNVIGGVAAGAGNVISGNFAHGIFVVAANGNVIQGNLIGTDVSGTQDLGNAFDGVAISGSSDNTVGGTTPGARNVISGNDQQGISIFFNAPAGNVVQGNFIGTDVTGRMDLGNGGRGIAIQNDAFGNTIGGTTPGAGNMIAYSGSRGVLARFGATGTAILSNSIFSNGGLGIDLEEDDVTPNDAGDGDTGANDLQNFPVLSSALRGNSTTIDGTLNSTPDTDFRVELFSNSACDPSDHGEGATFLDATDVTTDANGDATFTVTLAPSVSDAYVTATATDPNNNTSEFSQCVAVLTDFAVDVSPTSVTVTQGNAATYTVTVSPLGGSLDSAVAFSCSDIQALTVCSFSPSSITPSGDDATSTLTVATTATSTSAAPYFGEPSGMSVYPRWGAWFWLAIGGLAVVTLLWVLAHTKRRLSLTAAVAFLLLTLHGGCGGDDGGVNGPQVTPGTPSGTFTFTITGTAGSLEHATTATLIVQ